MGAATGSSSSGSKAPRPGRSNPASHAPQRCTRVVHGATRLGIRKKTVVYYGAHAIIDIGHAEGWLTHVIEAQVREFPDSRLDIAEGLIARADASLDYFDYCLSSCHLV